MIAKYTQAGIVSELKRLANPASVDSIPSSAMQEDHVSMGWSAARKLRRALEGVTTVLAVEILTAALGIDMRAPLKPSPATGAVIAALREQVDGRGPDRYLAPEIASAVALVASGAVVAAARTVTGPLDCPPPDPFPPPYGGRTAIPKGLSPRGRSGPGSPLPRPRL